MQGTIFRFYNKEVNACSFSFARHSTKFPAGKSEKFLLIAILFMIRNSPNIVKFRKIRLVVLVYFFFLIPFSAYDYFFNAIMIREFYVLSF